MEADSATEHQEISVLLIEDNPGDARLIQEYLSESLSTRFIVEHSDSLSQGFDSLHRKMMDIILLDLSLPDSHGFDTLKAVRSRSPDIPIVILTGLGDERVAVEAVKQGAQDYLVKGEVDSNLLVRSLRYAIERKKGEDKLSLYRRLLDNTHDAIYVVDAETGRFLDFNENACALMGYSHDELINMGVKDFEKGLSEDFNWGEHVNLLREQGFMVFEGTPRRKDGTTIPVEISAKFVDDRARDYVIAIHRDITERKRAQLELQQSEAKFRGLAESLDVIIYRADPETLVASYINSAIEKIYGYSVDEWLNDQTLWEKALHPEDLDRVVSALEQGKWGGNNGSIEYRIIHRDQSVHWVDDHYTWDKDSEGRITGLTGVVYDITEKKRVEDEIRHIAFFDTLTDLPNRQLFFNQMGEAIARAKRNSTSFGLLFIDLDNFKNINDTLGHSTGDLLLKEVTKRLTENLRPYDIVSRLGGDEFTTIVTDMSEQFDTDTVAERIAELLSDPFYLCGHELCVSCSIGISIFPDDGADAETLLQNADVAMYYAKSMGRNNYQHFTQEMNRQAKEQLILGGELRRALQNDEFMLHYQPQVEARTGEIIGHEALIRWNHPERGLIMPSDFIPIAEESGIVIAIDEWVLQRACEETRKLHESGFNSLALAVNLSALHFKEKNIVETVSRVLEKTGFSSGYLELEITEGVLMDDVETSLQLINELKSLGIKISMDDFGTGYSSLSYLKRFPIDKLKIDRSFIQEIATNESDGAITRTIISMAFNLNMNVIAEGVETQEQLEFLSAEGCNQIQGYYFSKPLPIDAYVELLKAGKMQLRHLPLKKGAA